MTKREINGYEVKHAFKLGGTEIILAENPATAEPYMVCTCSSNNSLGISIISSMAVSADYLDAVHDFVARLDAGVKQLESQRPLMPATVLTAADCVPGGMRGDLNGQVAVIKPERLAPEYRDATSQLVLVTGGFGASPQARGQAVYCTELLSKQEYRYDRGDIAGVISPDKMPGWAAKELAAIRGPRERESFEDKAKRLAEAARECPKQGKPRDHSNPEI